jgi:hypothetical protein
LIVGARYDVLLRRACALGGASPRPGVGSAVNDATRETGGTLRVAIIGSVSTSLYTSSLLGPTRHKLPPAVLHAAKSSVGAGYAAAGMRHPKSGSR